MFTLILNCHCLCTTAVTPVSILATPISSTTASTIDIMMTMAYADPYLLFSTIPICAMWLDHSLKKV